MAATARSATSSNRVTAARSWTCCCRSSSQRAPTSHREPRRGEMFNAAFVSSPDGGRTCFRIRKRHAKEKNGSRKKAIRFQILERRKNSGDRRNGLRQHFFGEEPVAPAHVILEFADV